MNLVLKSEVSMYNIKLDFIVGISLGDYKAFLAISLKFQGVVFFIIFDQTKKDFIRSLSE